MSFESRKSLLIELEAAKETYNRTCRKDDLEYLNEVRYAIVEDCIGDRFDLYNPKDVVKLQRDSYSAIETEGACFIFSRFIEKIGCDDHMDAYDNLSGKRTDYRGRVRWDCLDDYKIGTEEDIKIGGMVISGSVVYAEIWYDDAAVAYIPLN